MQDERTAMCKEFFKLWDEGEEIPEVELWFACNIMVFCSVQFSNRTNLQNIDFLATRKFMWMENVSNILTKDLHGVMKYIIQEIHTNYDVDMF